MTADGTVKIVPGTPEALPPEANPWDEVLEKVPPTIAKPQKRN